MRAFGPAVADSGTGTTIADPAGLSEWISSWRTTNTQNPMSVPPGGWGVGANPPYPLSLAIQRGGRLYLPGTTGGRVEFWPLFTDAAATATAQIWAFDPLTPTSKYIKGVDATKVDSVARFSAWPDSDGGTPNGPILGLGYPLARDISGAPVTVSFAALDTETVKLDFSGDFNEFPYPSTSGTVYRVGNRHIFSTAGAFAFFVYVVTVSAGSLLVLARSV